MPFVTVTVTVQAEPTAHFGGAVSVIDGLASSHLWTSSVDVMAPLFPPSTKISAEKMLAFAPPTVFLAASGVQEVASLFETWSIVCDELPVFCLYHDGKDLLSCLALAIPILCAGAPRRRAET